MRNFRLMRERMVEQQLIARGISDEAVLSAMREVPRHLFLPEALYSQAYGDHPVPIGHGQTISQPYIVGLMSQVLEAKKGMTVLEIGTGSAYQACVLAQMGLYVFTLERVQALYAQAKERFAKLGYNSIRFKLADGTLGWPENGPFDRIIVTAGGPDIPQPLIDQLADPGIMLIPVGSNKGEQRLVRVFKQDGEVSAKALTSRVAFVDLVGRHAWGE